MGRILRVEIMGGIADDGQSRIDGQKNQQPGMGQSTNCGRINTNEAAQSISKMISEEPRPNHREAVRGGKEDAGVGTRPDCLALRSALNEIAQVCKLLVTPC